MTEHSGDRRLVAFVGGELIARGAPVEVALAVRRFLEGQAACTERIAIYDDGSGAPVDLDCDGDEEAVRARVEAEYGAGPADAPRGPGRPKLGVVSREVSLLPRHWDYLASQPGGASAALRRLVEGARKSGAAGDRRRRAVEAAHRFMWDLVGDAPGFEEASRALFAHDFGAFSERIRSFPPGVQVQLMRFVERAG